MTGTSFDYVDVEYCRTNNIVVCNTPNYTGAAVAEHAVALMLTTAKHIVELNATFDSNVLTLDNTAFELDGKTVGIVGLGDIGRRIAGMTQGFGMNVVYVNRSAKNMPNARQVGLDELLQTADVTFLTLPLAESNRGMIDVAALETMKSNAILVNVSSEDLVDRHALINALQTEVIAGAALDIPSPSPLYKEVPRLIVTPARGWYTPEGLHRRASVWIDTLRSAMEGAPTNIVAP